MICFGPSMGYEESIFMQFNGDPSFQDQNAIGLFTPAFIWKDEHDGFKDRVLSQNEAVNLFLEMAHR